MFDIDKMLKKSLQRKPNVPMFNPVNNILGNRKMFPDFSSMNMYRHARKEKNI